MPKIINFTVWITTLPSPSMNNETFATTFEDQVEKFKNKIVVLNIGGSNSYIGKVNNVEEQIVEFQSARDISCLFKSSSYKNTTRSIKLFNLPTHFLHSFLHKSKLTSIQLFLEVLIRGDPFQADEKESTAYFFLDLLSLNTHLVIE